MSIVESSYVVTPCLMEGYRHYLIYTRKMTQLKVQMCVNIVRKFHNYIGKPYVDVSQDDIQGYLDFLGEFELLKYETLSRHLAGIKKFYQYLSYRGEVFKNPCDGVAIKG